MRRVACVQGERGDRQSQSSLGSVLNSEVIPQPLSVWHGLVCALMYLLAPVAYPTLRALDTLLGADAPCVHVQEGAARSRCANTELSILNGALELGAKSVVQLMTPMRDVVTLADDTVLDDGLTQYMYVPLECHSDSRFLVHEPGAPNVFSGCW
ncbi:hypothetical protein GGX14DRAFT_699657 [Mycena pura]|uniref:Uncharacterized protein n=1 Tax=Mycena pura TaxID=153505 RepID=A0AAD6V470_9AGAR|nr:hypothetical protein GGX14DRAFT_699657 [Mycena pura]